MKYSVLLKFLRILIYFKRFFWWTGTRIYFVLAKILGIPGRFFILLHYKASYLVRKAGLTSLRETISNRDFLVTAVFLVLFLIGLNETTLLPKTSQASSGQKTIAYGFLGTDEEVGVEEIVSSETYPKYDTPFWKIGALDTQFYGTGYQPPLQANDLAAIVAGGTAFNKPFLIPGSTLGSARNQVVQYVVEPGDSLGGIAYNFGVSIPTVMWENNLTLKSIIKPGNILKIPPTTGIMYTIKKKDTINKIATAYEAKPEDIVRFNHLKEDGTDLVVGERIMLPGGIKPKEKAITQPASSKTLSSLASRVATPPSASFAPSASGFVWPSGARTITQYFSFRHHAVDIAGPRQTPNYAAKAGTVEVSQCGWNSGYGCYIIINHGGGIKTLYGHNSQLLVSVGDYVETGQSIALMGNTGKVRGVTGVHVHFEVQKNGVRVNPLGYVK
ncbi:MAG: hypothetical protein A2754_03550 [Candidatus Magasanikbacteria bacterium RIFCSPHIGHO2_01_FULL_47_8]|uniref:LysM domain-containing protein n=1 Tax=Candidatus Magasanikbacteria bacterium RIFCSPHIGHO2_01_FULL_47_8 TaxID=1798673 RepID=A0A1F6MCV0_9BACT|nr:MAG: hypothetical protein A2754_03550 [Candidatus Magasanikbacteria bacterium RIFCSPHIGHO2_01_FULL_47_8]